MASLTGFTSQQLVQFTDCLQPDNSAMVSIKKANSYSARGLRESQLAYQNFLPMTVAIESGIFQLQKQFTDSLSSGCVTGNCTFQSSPRGTFSTLAIVHSCKDVTSEVTAAYENGTKAVPGIDESGLAIEYN